MKGPDHEFALEPDELNKMVSAIRDTETALGIGQKRVLEVEDELYEKGRRAIQATTSIEAGEELSSENVSVLRPGERETGMHPKFYDEILDKIASQDIRKGEGVHWNKIRR